MQDNINLVDGDSPVWVRSIPYLRSNVIVRNELIARNYTLNVPIRAAKTVIYLVGDTLYKFLVCVVSCKDPQWLSYSLDNGCHG